MHIQKLTYRFDGEKGTTMEKAKAEKAYLNMLIVDGHFNNSFLRGIVEGWYFSGIIDANTNESLKEEIRRGNA